MMSYVHPRVLMLCRPPDRRTVHVNGLEAGVVSSGWSIRDGALTLDLLVVPLPWLTIPLEPLYEQPLRNGSSFSSKTAQTTSRRRGFSTRVFQK